MQTLEQQMSFYLRYHRNPWNKLTHFFGVPIIISALFISFGWLRIPVGMAAAGGVGAVVAGALAKATILDITGTIAGLSALTGTILAVAKRRKIIGEYRRQMNEKREAMTQAIEDHLRHAVKRFFVELEQLFQPLEAFCAAQKKMVEPSLASVREMEVKLGKCAASLGAAGKSPA